MKVFPKLSFEERTNKKTEEIHHIFDAYLKTGKYVGYWRCNCFFLHKNVVETIIIPVIKIDVIDEQIKRLVKVEFEIKPRFETIMQILIFLFGTIGVFLICFMAINHSFSFALLIPFMICISAYIIFYGSYSWEAEGFKSDLTKKLNKF